MGSRGLVGNPWVDGVAPGHGCQCSTCLFIFPPPVAQLSEAIPPASVEDGWMHTKVDCRPSPPPTCLPQSVWLAAEQSQRTHSGTRRLQVLFLHLPPSARALQYWGSRGIPTQGALSNTGTARGTQGKAHLARGDSLAVLQCSTPTLSWSRRGEHHTTVTLLITSHTSTHLATSHV
jgi:hypothetical protein